MKLYFSCLYIILFGSSLSTCQDCGQLDGQYCSYGCGSDSTKGCSLKCPWYNTAIHLDDGKYGYWNCSDQCDSCVLPGPDELCMNMTEVEWDTAVASCEGNKSCDHVVTDVDVSNSACCDHQNKECGDDQTSHMTALMWSCVPENADMKSVRGCYADPNYMRLTCMAELVINILHSEFGKSPCAVSPPNGKCCTSHDDCIVLGEDKPERIRNISGTCQGKVTCDIKADWIDNKCFGGPTDYESIYYKCVKDTRTSDMPPATSVSTNPQETITSDMLPATSVSTTTQERITSSSEPGYTPSTNDDSSSSVTHTLMQPQDSSRKLIFIVVGIIIVVFVAAIISVFLYRRKKKSSASKSSSPPQHQKSVANQYDGTDDKVEDHNYYDIGDFNGVKHFKGPQGDEYAAPDTTLKNIKPDIPKKPIPNGVNKNSVPSSKVSMPEEEGEMEDYYDTSPQSDDPTQVQEAERFQSRSNEYSLEKSAKSSNNVAYGQPLAGDYSYAYGHMMEADDAPLDYEEVSDKPAPQESDETMIEENDVYG